jgi:Ca2+-binding EF-hand superfamily protein
MNRSLPLIVACGCVSLPAVAQTASEQAADLGLQFLHKADANADGDITRQELRNFRSRAFPRADRDGDGFISLKDVPSRYHDRAKDKLENSKVIAAFDANDDRQVSRSEFEEGPTLVFDHADADKDGTVTQSELIAARTATAAS